MSKFIKFSERDTAGQIDWERLPAAATPGVELGAMTITNVIISSKLRYENDPEGRVPLDVDAISLNMPDCVNIPDSWHASVIRCANGVTMSLFRSGSTTCACVGTTLDEARARIDEIVAVINDSQAETLPKIVVHASKVSNIMTIISTSHTTNIPLIKRCLRPNSFRHEPEVSPPVTWQPFGKKNVFVNFFAGGNHVVGNCKDQADMDAVVAFLRPFLTRTCVVRERNPKYVPAPYVPLAWKPPCRAPSEPASPGERTSSEPVSPKSFKRVKYEQETSVLAMFDDEDIDD